MSQYLKDLMTNDFQGRFDGCNEFMVISLIGLGGNDNNALRGELLKKGIRLTTVKNSLMQRALKNNDMESAADLFNTGSCTVAYGGDSVVDLAKELVKYAKEYKVIEIKGAYVEGEALESEKAKELSKMKSRVELQGEVVMLAMSPGRQVAGAIAGPGGIIAGCIKAIADKEDAA